VNAKPIYKKYIKLLLVVSVFGGGGYQ